MSKLTVRMGRLCDFLIFMVILFYSDNLYKKLLKKEFSIKLRNNTLKAALNYNNLNKKE